MGQKQPRSRPRSSRRAAVSSSTCSGDVIHSRYRSTAAAWAAGSPRPSRGSRTSLAGSLCQDRQRRRWISDGQGRRSFLSERRAARRSIAVRRQKPAASCSQNWKRKAGGLLISPPAQRPCPRSNTFQQERAGQAPASQSAVAWVIRATANSLQLNIARPRSPVPILATDPPSEVFSSWRSGPRW
jgi:hypothetical protein